MNELAGPFVTIVLSIREGRGFDFLQGPLLIEATLKSNKIEADPVLPDPNPAVCTELVWETEKKEIRKLRSSHVPLRVECFALNQEQRKEKIGFILLSLRSAQAVAGNQVVCLEHKWHKLVSVASEYRVCHPELALILTIRDRLYQEVQNISRPITPQIDHIIHDDGNNGDFENPTVIPILYLEEGLIQIGENNPDFRKFILTFHIGTAFNLDLLLPVNAVFNQNTDKYYLALSILGLTINTKYFFNHLHEPIILNDRVIFKLQTSIEILKIFFEQFQAIPLSFHHGNEILASTEINLKNFSIDEEIENSTSCKYEQVCEFRCSENGLIPVSEGRKPYVTTQTILERDTTLRRKSGESEKSLSVSISEASVPESVEDTQKASGDQEMCYETKLVSARRPKVPCEDAAVQTTPREHAVAKSTSTILKNQISSKKSLPQLSSSFTNLTNYQLFSLTITFHSITWRKPLNLEGFQFKFQHPKANNILLIQCDLDNMSSTDIIALENVYCMMHFITTNRNIKSLITMYPPKISIENLNNETITEEFQLYTKMLLTKNEDECSYFAVLNKVDDEDDLLCDLQIEMKITELGSNFANNNEDRPFDLDPIILDECLALKTLQDLEELKVRQEEIYTENLKRMETEKLKTLQLEWTTKRQDLEARLKQDMEKCQVLSRELSIAIAEMKQKKMELEQRELLTPENREDVEIRVTQMLEEEMNKTVNQITKEKERLKQKLDQSNSEKENLLALIQAKDNELEEVRKTSLTKDQTACLLREIRHLEEKYQHVHKAKTFFKEQWNKALREVHALKSEDQRQIQQEIRKNKEELSQLSLDGSDAFSDTADAKLYRESFDAQSYFY